MCHEVSAVTVAVVNIESRAGGSPRIATFSVPPFFGSPAGLAPSAGFAAAGAPPGAGCAAPLSDGTAPGPGAAGGACCGAQADASEVTAPAAMMPSNPISTPRRHTGLTGKPAKLRDA